MKPYCAFKTDTKTRIRFWFPKCISGALYGAAGCTCTKPVARTKRRDPLEVLSTMHLLEVLSKRPGVHTHFVQCAEPYHIVVGGGREQGLGSAQILVVATGESA